MKPIRRYAPNRIRELRQKRGLSLEALGAAMPSQLTPSTVSKLEKGHMALSADYILEIAEVMGVEPIEVLLEDRAQAARFVPLIPWGQTAEYVEGKFNNMEVVAIPAAIEGSQLFAIEVEKGQASGLLESGFVTVDPRRLTLEDGGWFVIAWPQGEIDLVQFSVSPPAFRSATSSNDAEPIAIGSRPFTVLGRVVYIGQAIA